MKHYEETRKQLLKGPFKHADLNAAFEHDISPFPVMITIVTKFNKYKNAFGERIRECHVFVDTRSHCMGHLFLVSYVLIHAISEKYQCNAWLTDSNTLVMPVSEYDKLYRKLKNRACGDYVDKEGGSRRVKAELSVAVKSLEELQQIHDLFDIG